MYPVKYIEIIMAQTSKLTAELGPDSLNAQWLNAIMALYCSAGGGWQ